MSKIGLRLGWNPPSPFHLSQTFPDRAELIVGKRLKSIALRKIEAACDKLIEAQVKAGAEARYAPTLKILKSWASVYKSLYVDVFKPLREKSWDPNVSASWMMLAERADQESALELPEMKGFLSEIECMRHLTAVALKDFEKTHGRGSGRDPRGRESDDSVMCWIADVAAILERAGVIATSKTRRGPRLDDGFMKLLEELRTEMCAKNFETFHLPAHKRLCELARETVCNGP